MRDKAKREVKQKHDFSHTRCLLTSCRPPTCFMMSFECISTHCQSTRWGEGRGDGIISGVKALQVTDVGLLPHLVPC